MRAALHIHGQWQRTRHDEGFTLVELLVTIVIVGIIALPLGNLVLSYFLNTNTTTGRLSESHDEQIAAAYFSQDIAAAGSRDANQALQPSAWVGSFPSPGCASSVSGSNQVLLLKSDDVSYTNGAASPTVQNNWVAYVIGQSSSGERQLHRIFCTGSSQASDIVVVHNLSSAVTPQVSCSSTCTQGMPMTVTLTVGIASQTGSGQPYTLTLTGTRRQSS